MLPSHEFHPSAFSQLQVLSSNPGVVFVLFLIVYSVLFYFLVLFFYLCRILSSQVKIYVLFLFIFVLFPTP